jgi:hypothetical protein
LRLGAVAGVSGVVLTITMGYLHPSAEQPNNSVAAFHEYAHSQHWTSIHMGQFVGALLIVIALVSLGRPLSRRPGPAGALAVVGTLTAVLVAAVFAVQMAVDGVALKGTIDAWSHATSATDQATAFQTAEAIRWIEKALSAFFHLVNGITLLMLGAAIAVGRPPPRWLGWIGVVAGIGVLAGSWSTAHTGFSPQASTILLLPSLLTMIFVLGVSGSMWRRSRTIA